MRRSRRTLVRLRDLPRGELLATCAAFRIRADDDSLAAITRLTLRELAARIAFLDAQLKSSVARLRRITTEFAPDLVAKQGVGPDTASTLLLTAGDNPDRLHSERAFASLVGSSPVAAGSGQKQNRFRLNRGGDRQANATLWRIAMVRLRYDQPTRDYLAKRQAEGKTKSEGIRCLKRYIAREIYNSLPKVALS